MSDYLVWDEKTITDFSNENINSLYNEGYVFTRKGKGIMQKTRSVRIDLNKFELSSENKRILRKTKEIRLANYFKLPLDEYYNWTIGKMAKDFYEIKFGKGTFSANKMKEILNNKEKSNFNLLLVYKTEYEKIGYAVCLETDEIIHYSYPFYDLNYSNKNIGMKMMLEAIRYANENGKKYIFLGSAQRPADIYKLQFKGLEWFNEKKWQTGIKELKNILSKNA